MSKKQASKHKDRADDDLAVDAAPAGPLGPWRLALAIVSSAAFTGMDLSEAATTGVGLDMALLRSFGVAFLTWIALSSINRVLAHAEAKAAVDDALASSRSADAQDSGWSDDADRMHSRPS